jgi:hypothetical protein
MKALRSKNQPNKLFESTLLNPSRMGILFVLT